MKGPKSDKIPANCPITTAKTTSFGDVDLISSFSSADCPDTPAKKTSFGDAHLISSFSSADKQLFQRQSDQSLPKLQTFAEDDLTSNKLKCQTDHPS